MSLRGFRKGQRRKEIELEDGPSTGYCRAYAVLPHQEIKASESENLHCVLVRSGPKGLVVNLDLAPVEVPELALRFDYSAHVAQTTPSTPLISVLNSSPATVVRQWPIRRMVGKSSISPGDARSGG